MMRFCHKPKMQSKYFNLLLSIKQIMVCKIVDPDETMEGDLAELDSDLSEYLEVLGSAQRMKILKYIHKESKDEKELSRKLETSIQNIEKHINKLLSIGLVRIEYNLGKETARGRRIVKKYCLIPGALEAISRNFWIFYENNTPNKQHFAIIEKKFIQEFSSEFPVLKVLGGPDDGKIFLITSDCARIGRYDPKQTKGFDPGRDFPLSSYYKTVTRVSHPHAKIIHEKEQYYLEDSSKHGTFINGTEITQKTKLSHGDLINLSQGKYIALLVFYLPLISSDEYS
jgi:DNA-binding transcriptional ArsR family regulator